MTPQERQTFADAADAAIGHPLVQETIAESAGNLQRGGLPEDLYGLWHYSLIKCLNAATQVARAQALDIDPQELLMSTEETTAHMARLRQMALDAGKPAIRITGPRRAERDGA